MGYVALAAKIGNKICAINALEVQEVFRPLPIEEFSSFPSFVLGLSIIRGIQTPVVRLSLIIEGDKNISYKGNKKIWILIKNVEKRIAIEVDSIVGIFELPYESFQSVPTLLEHAYSDSITACGILDNQLLLLLQTTRFIPEDVWEKITPLANSLKEKGTP